MPLRGSGVGAGASGVGSAHISGEDGLYYVMHICPRTPLIALLPHPQPLSAPLAASSWLLLHYSVTMSRTFFYKRLQLYPFATFPRLPHQGMDLEGFLFSWPTSLLGSGSNCFFNTFCSLLLPYKSCLMLLLPIESLSLPYLQVLS